MQLTHAESAALEARVKRVEERTGLQVVTAVVGKADSYSELPWMAFALGATLAGFLVALADAAYPAWPTWHVVATALAILGSGAASALAAIFVPAYARLYLTKTRRDAEVRHYAQALFLRRELFKTRERNAVLILVARFERKVEILPDTGLHEAIGSAEWRKLIARMTPLLRDGRCAAAFEAGLDALEEVANSSGLQHQAGLADELADRPIDSKGAR